MKKRVSMRAICLLVAVAILVGALTVSAVNGSPYENLKNAVINAIFYDNVTVDLTATLWIDGVEHEHAWLNLQQGHKSRVTTDYIHSPIMHQVDEELQPFVQDVFTLITYETEGVHISRWFVMPDGTQWFQANRRTNRFYSSGGFATSIGYEIFGPAGRASNQLRLTELVVDLLVGDLKNNFMMETHGDIRRISGAITESQLPEFVRVIIDIAIDEHQRWVDDYLEPEDFQHILQMPMRGVSIDRIALTADVDNDGNLLYVNVRGMATIENIFGDVHVVEGEISARFTEIGTTVPEPPVQGASELFTEEFFRNTGNMWGSLFFIVDDNGNIVHDSITSQAPWRVTQNDLIRLDLDNINIDNLLANNMIRNNHINVDTWLNHTDNDLSRLHIEILSYEYEISALIEQLLTYEGELTDDEIDELRIQIDYLQEHVNQLIIQTAGH